jgi:Tfp pilus assembly protein PilP
MKLTSSILAVMISAGAWAQSPNIIQSTQDKLNAVQQQKTADSDAALGIQVQPASKPTPAVPATGASAAKPAPSKPAAAKPVVVKATASKPAATQAASAPATSATAATPAATATASGKPATKSAATKPAAAAAASKPATANATAGKPAGPTVIPGPKVVAAPAANTASKAAVAAKPVAAKTVAVIVPKTDKSAKGKKAQAKSTTAAPAKPEEKKYAMTGKRDPFLSPVVSHMGGSGCNTGKKCLEIGQVNLKGVVKSDAGMIAVVTNSINKAYFLRENDPVFNGYVEKITGDSITFKETFQDKLGKSLTRDVVKKILTPAV